MTTVSTVAKPPATDHGPIRLPVEWPSQLSRFEPVIVTAVDLESGLHSLHESKGVASCTASMLVLVRLHSHPLGLVRLEPQDYPHRTEWTRCVRETLGTAIACHVQSDTGASEPPEISDEELWEGLPGGWFPCLQDRMWALNRAPMVSVVVATRERPASLAVCLASLQRLSYPKFEILVVDNDPVTPVTEALVREQEGPVAVRYLRENRRGLGAAHNRALPDATGEILAFTDDDVVVDQHWLSELVTPFVLQPRVAGATGLLLPAELETAAQLMLETHGRFTKGFENALFDTGRNRPPDPLFPFTAGRLGSGANMAFSAAYLRQSGGFDSALGTGTLAKGGDDLAAIFGLMASGLTLAYRPGALIWHRHHRELAALERQAYGYGVGLGAYLTSAVLHRPRAALWMLPKIKGGIMRAVGEEADPRSREAERSTSSDEWALMMIRLQRRGLVIGPFAYLASLVKGLRAAPSADGDAARARPTRSPLARFR